MRRLTVGFAALMLTTALAGATMAPAAGPKAYVGLFKDDAVAVIDVTQNRVLSTIPVPKGPHGLVITPDGRKVLVSGFGSDRVLVIDTASEKVTGEVAVPQVHNGAISPDGSRAWVGSQKQGETAIYVIDLQTMKRVGSLVLDKTPRALDTSPDGRHVYFTLAGINAVQVLDTATTKVVAQVPVGASPHLSPSTPDGRWALVAVQGPGELAIVDTASNSVVATVPVGMLPHWIAIAPDGRTAWVAN